MMHDTSFFDAFASFSSGDFIARATTGEQALCDVFIMEIVEAETLP